MRMNSYIVQAVGCGVFTPYELKTRSRIGERSRLAARVNSDLAPLWANLPASDSKQAHTASPETPTPRGFLAHRPGQLRGLVDVNKEIGRSVIRV